MIDLIGAEKKHRIRTWKWSLNDEFQGLTMIDERQTAIQSEIPESFYENLASRRFMGVSRSNK
jgi:hypothetical protein